MDKGSILELVDKGVAGIMAALIAVDNSCVIQLGSIFAAHGVNHVENKIDSKIVTELVGQYFMCTDIQNRGQITDPASVKKVGNICQQGLTRRIVSELSVNLVLCHIVLPIEMRRTLGIGEKDFLEIFIDGNTIVLEKYSPACIFCGSAKNNFDYKGKRICRDCLSNL